MEEGTVIHSSKAEIEEGEIEAVAVVVEEEAEAEEVGIGLEAATSPWMTWGTVLAMDRGTATRTINQTTTIRRLRGMLREGMGTIPRFQRLGVVAAAVLLEMEARTLLGMMEGACLISELICGI